MQPPELNITEINALQLHPHQMKIFIFLYEDSVQHTISFLAQKVCYKINALVSVHSLTESSQRSTRCNARLAASQAFLLFLEKKTVTSRL